MCIVSVLEPRVPPVNAGNIIHGRRSILGSGIGGMAETQEMIDFSAKNGIVSDVEVVTIQAVNEAWDRLAKNDVKYRFVIDMASLRVAA